MSFWKTLVKNKTPSFTFLSFAAEISASWQEEGVTEVLPFQVKFPNLFSIYRNSGKTNGMEGGGEGEGC